MLEYVNVVIPPLPRPFTYRVPEPFARKVRVGSRVEVPFGRRSATGFVVSDLKGAETNGGSTFEIKQIVEVLHDFPCFDPAQLDFFQWVADYYGAPLSNVIEVAVPPAATPKFRRFFSLQHPAGGEAAAEAKGALQKRIIDFMREQGREVESGILSKRFKGSAAAIKSMLHRGQLSERIEEVVDQHISAASAPAWAKQDVDLNSDQTNALQRINEVMEKKVFRPILLHGVTGSGKTEVYIEAVRNAMERGVGALIIVPEIALTPQLIDRFRARLGNQIAILHSGLNRRSRWDSWRALLERRNSIAIGARSCIFAPVHNLGLIIVDEEHDGSYKQSDGLRYNARDLALVRGKKMSCPVVLGSATPSLESYYNAATKKYAYLKLPARHGNASQLKFDLVDLNAIKPWDMPTKNISPRLFEHLRTTIERKEQAFILYNRRGFASYLQCEKCEHVVGCPHCSVTLTYHQHSNTLLCHYCNLSSLPPQFCPDCIARIHERKQAAAGGDVPEQAPGKLIQRGAGTERINDEIQQLFPDARIDRLDRDVATDLAKYQHLLDNVRSGRTDVLVGTQMIAKGHDLPGVTLVGIVDCDVGLHMPDFRASERVFQLLTQASGRAGRGDLPGTVVLQTRVPQHLSLTKTLQNDFEGFARLELANRHDLNYPPFARLLRIVASSREQEMPLIALNHIRQLIESFPRPEGHELTILGPAPAPLGKLKTEWRWHLMLKSKHASDLARIIRELQPAMAKVKKLKVIFDLDAQEML